MSGLLTVDSLRVDLGRHHKVRVLDGVSFEVRAGEVVGLIGETGSGKSTIARAILGALSPASGTVTVQGTNVGTLRGRRRRLWRRNGAVQYIFQDPLRSLDPDHTVAQSVGEGLRIGRVPGPEVESRVSRALADVGLDQSLRGRRPAELSGGQRQRAAIARALVMRPSLLICDEPVSALDASSRDRVLRTLTNLRTTGDLGVLVISHDIGSLAALADRILVLHDGVIVESGPTRDLLADPQHPYTRLLVASVPVIGVAGITSAERHRLRSAVAAATR
jgi:ABC-type dipeptide/oligopeptide/nickel transport system ATPase subunit